MKNELGSNQSAGAPVIRLIQIMPFVQFFEQKFGDPDRILSRFGLDRGAVQNQDLFVHGEIIYGLTTSFSEAADDPYFGVRVGEWLPIAARHSFAEPCRHARTVGEFLIRWIEQVPAHASSVHHRMVVGPQRSQYEVDRFLEPQNSPAQAEGFATAQYAKLLESILGTIWDPSDIGLETRYNDAIPLGYKGFTIKMCNVPGMRLTLPTSWLHAKIDAEHMREVNEESRELATLSPASVVAGVRGAFHSLHGMGNITPENVARAIGLSIEALSTALQRERTSLAKEIKNLKMETARRNLSETDLPISKIAEDLGYQDAANFTRFFRTKTGMSPRAYRRIAKD